MRNISTTDINHILYENAVTRRYFVGTFPACMAPKTRRKLYTFITNSEEHDKAGEHWNAWRVKNQDIIFFDSFSRAPTHPTFPSYYSDIISNFDNVYFVSKRVQSITSEFCGIFCIHWIYIMSLGLDCESFLSDYTPDYVKNDVIVKNIVKSF